MRYLSILFLSAITAAAQSPAHDASKAFNIDPAYNANDLQPAADVSSGTPWIYGDDQLEAWKIAHIVEDGFATNRHVGYERNYGKVTDRIFFRHPWSDALGISVTIRTNAKLAVRGHPALASVDPKVDQSLTLTPDMQADGYLTLELNSIHGEPAALLISSGPYKTDTGWESSTDGKSWSPATTFPQSRSGLLPHQTSEPLVMLKPVKQEDGVYDFGIVLLGRPVFECSGTPEIVTGESVEETGATAAQQESRFDLERRPDGRWTSVHALGFRYLKITGDQVSNVAVEASVHSVQYRGAFASSDDELTKIWMHAALTLHNCMQGLMVDGVKRDRMPWIGDQASNLIANSYSFADSEITRESFTALGRPTGGFINGIVDYSLWWVINQRIYQRYFDSPEYLRHELPHIDAELEKMTAFNDGNGMLKPPSGSWVFIDWGVKMDGSRTYTALQIMWYWAQRSGQELAEKAGDAEMAAKWKSRADALAAQLYARGWDPSAHAWREYLDGGYADSPYPNFLAVLSNLAPPNQFPGIKQNLLAYPCPGTPFMRGFYLSALTQVGGADAVTKELRAYWGGMLERGATTFWENFMPGQADDHAMYDRPFGRSLCHAWSSGPLAILPQTILGIRPLTDGWKEFEVDPHLGDLTWADATVPTPAGNVEVEVRSGKAMVKFPAGLTLVYNGQKFQGPNSVEETFDQSAPAEQTESAHTLKVSSLDLSKMKQGFGTAQIDKSVSGNVLHLGGTAFAEGIGTHANSLLVIDLAGQAQHFHSIVGVDDDAGNALALVRFTLKGDDRVLWQSEPMGLGQSKMVDVDLTGIISLQLITEMGRSNAEYDHADWAAATISYQGKTPVALNPGSPP